MASIPSRIKHKRGNASQEEKDFGIDEVAVERAITEGNIRLSPMELKEAIRILFKRGMSGHQIARQLGCSSGTAHKHIKAFGVQ